MKILHLIPNTVYEKHKWSFSAHHGLVVGDHVLTIGNIGQSHQATLEAEQGVLPLPFVLSSEPVGQAIAQHLSTHGVQATHKVYEVAALVAKTHVGFHFSQF